MIIDELIEVALRNCGNRKVVDLRLGVSYTGILLDDNSCGLAYTFRNDLGSCCTLFNEAGTLKGRSVKELIPWSKDRNLAKASIGVAAINSIINKQVENYEQNNIMELINIKQDETFGMIGNFKPILKEVRKMTDKIYVFEKNKMDDLNIYPESAIDEYLPKCDIVLITGTSVINKTIDNILEKTKNAREIYIVGPSTTLCLEVFKKYGVSVLAGSIVKSPLEILDIISQGGGTIAMKKAVEQVVLNQYKF